MLADPNNLDKKIKFIIITVSALFSGMIIDAAILSVTRPSNPISSILIKNNSSQTLKSGKLVYSTGLGNDNYLVLDSLAPNASQTLIFYNPDEAGYSLTIFWTDGTQIDGGAGYIENGWTLTEIITDDGIMSQFTPFDDPVNTTKLMRYKDKADVSDAALLPPLSDATSRITKKPFGIYISPDDSPVQPERFTGYHTGTDFEIFDDEADADVIVTAVCDGKIIQKQKITGYGGVIVQECEISGKTLSVLYGHLAINDTDTPAVDSYLEAGAMIALLAPANSEYSGNERKHLHLGIYYGSSIDVRGYVDDEIELKRWMDFEGVVKPD